MMPTLAKGFVSGAWGTAAMAGTALTIRRLARPPGEVGKTHYECVVEWVWARLPSLAGQVELTSPRRCRTGEAIHFLFGGVGGMAFAAITSRARRHPDPVLAGGAFGTAMWLAAFGGYMPGLGITGGLRDWDGHERLRTFGAHAAYGITTGLVFDALQRREDAGVTAR